MSNSTIDYTIEKFLISNEPVMKIAIDVLEILGKINKLTMKGSGESCPPTVAVANIITQNMLKGKTKIDKILVDSEVLGDGRLISIIEVTITKIN